MTLRDDINRKSAENKSDTLDFILSEYRVICLAAFEKALASREAWHSVPERRILEGLIDRACKENRLPRGLELSEFIDWVRSLYPEFYKKRG